MEIKLTNKESEDIFFNSLCNGLNQMVYYELRLTYNDSDYEQARSKFSEQPCYEDVLMQILRDGNSLTMLDLEGEESYSINLQDVHERVQQAPVSTLLEAIEERDDADTADAILQQVFFGEVMFG
jgi:hypothetical protein